MSAMNNRNYYGWMAIALHWLLFLLITGLVVTGKFSSSLEPGEKIGVLIGNHKQIGVAVLVLMAFRLLWKLINASVESISGEALLRILAFINHWLLYLVVMAQALSGIIMSQLGGRDVSLFGLPLPALVGDNGLLGDMFSSAEQMRDFHTYGGYAIIALVLIHIIAALVHHFYWQDDTLRRMWFGYRPSYTKDVNIIG